MTERPNEQHDRIEDFHDSYVAQALSPDQHGEHWSGPPEMVERIASVLGTGREDRVLDLGCGIGGPARQLASLAGCRIVGVDILEPVLLAARGRMTSARLSAGRVRYVAADAAVLPFSDGVFDQVWALGMVAHLPNVAGMVSETARVLAAGGAVAFTEAFWAGGEEPRFATSAPWPWNLLTAAQLACALRSAGFRQVRVLPWPAPSSCWDEIDHPALREDLRVGRLAPALVCARS